MRATTLPPHCECGGRLVYERGPGDYISCYCDRCTPQWIEDPNGPMIRFADLALLADQQETPTPKELDLDSIKARAAAATDGPWQIVEDHYDEVPTSGKLAGRVAQRRIFTTWDHPQLHGPWGVVNGYTSIAKIGGHEPPNHGVAIAAEDAEFIVHARTDIPLLISEIERLRRAAHGEDDCK